jgi:hypothetical protein
MRVGPVGSEDAEAVERLGSKQAGADGVADGVLGVGLVP